MNDHETTTATTTIWTSGEWRGLRKKLVDMVAIQSKRVINMKARGEWERGGDQRGPCWNHFPANYYSCPCLAVVGWKWVFAIRTLKSSSQMWCMCKVPSRSLYSLPFLLLHSFFGVSLFCLSLFFFLCFILALSPLKLFQKGITRDQFQGQIFRTWLYLLWGGTEEKESGAESQNTQAENKKFWVNPETHETSGTPQQSTTKVFFSLHVFGRSPVVLGCIDWFLSCVNINTRFFRFEGSAI